MNPLARFSFPKLPAAPKGGTIPLKGANRTMDKILNLLSLTPGEKEAFLAAAPGRIHPPRPPPALLRQYPAGYR